MSSLFFAAINVPNTQANCIELKTKKTKLFVNIIELKVWRPISKTNRSRHTVAGFALINSSPSCWWLADTPAREPERFFVVQAALLESGDGIAQMRFQFTPVVGREIGLRGQFVPPVFNGGVQVETGLIFHNLHREL